MQSWVADSLHVDTPSMGLLCAFFRSSRLNLGCWIIEIMDSPAYFEIELHVTQLGKQSQVQTSNWRCFNRQRISVLKYIYEYVLFVLGMHLGEWFPLSVVPKAWRAEEFLHVKITRFKALFTDTCGECARKPRIWLPLQTCNACCYVGY